MFVWPGRHVVRVHVLHPLVTIKYAPVDDKREPRFNSASTDMMGWRQGYTRKTARRDGYQWMQIYRSCSTIAGKWLFGQFSPSSVCVCVQMGDLLRLPSFYWLPQNDYRDEARGEGRGVSSGSSEAQWSGICGLTVDWLDAECANRFRYLIVKDQEEG